MEEDSLSMMSVTSHSPVGRALRRLRGAEGQTLAEYGALLAIIALVVVALAILVGSEVSALFVPLLHYL